MFPTQSAKSHGSVNAGRRGAADAGIGTGETLSKLSAKMKKEAGDTFDRFALIFQGEAGVEKNVVRALSSCHYEITCAGDFGALVKRRQNTEVPSMEERHIVITRDSERSELISATKNAVENSRKIQNDMAEQLPGRARNHDQVQSALENLADALTACEEKDDEDNSFVVMQALISYIVATEKLDNCLSKSIFPERIQLVNGEAYLRLGNSVDQWTENTDGRRQIMVSKLLGTRFRSSPTLGDYSHPLRPSLVLKIAKHAGGDSFARAIFNEDGRLIKSTGIISMKPEIMAEMIFESSGRAPARGSSKIGFDDIREIFMDLMGSDPGGAGFQLANLSPVEFSERCETAILKFRHIEDLAGGAMRRNSEEGKSPYQNLVLVLANMPRDQRQSAMASLCLYRNRRADIFVTSGVAKLAQTCLESLGKKPEPSQEDPKLSDF